MKKKIIILLAFAIAAGTGYAETEKTVKSKIKNVTVFPRGAQVYRKAYISVAPGITKIIFEPLAAGIQTKNIQANGNGSFTIMDVKHETRYAEIQLPAEISKYQKEIMQLGDSITIYDFTLSDISLKRTVLQTEKSIISNNEIMKGKLLVDSMPQTSFMLFKEAMKYYRQQMNEINRELHKLKIAEHKVKLRKTKVQTKLNDLNALRNQLTNGHVSSKTINRVIVTVSSKITTKGSVTISYVLRNAGWTPSYDLRVNSTSAPVQLVYKANVQQSTGVDWEGVKLTLSTSDPYLQNVKPELHPFVIDYYNYAVAIAGKRKDESKKLSRSLLDYASAAPAMEDEVILPAKTSAEYTTMSELVTNVEFNISLPYSIPSDSKTHFVAIQDENIPSVYEHISVPKIERNAFMLAKLTDWENLNLLPAQANIYFEGTYVGETYINPYQMVDTLELSLGRDKAVIATRKKLKDKVKERILGHSKFKIVTYEITLKNHKSTSATLSMTDQIPISRNEEIKVELVDADGAELNETTGVLTWDIKLDPKESRTLKFTYEIKYNKDKMLAIL